jgi:hypothetical protein
MAGIVRGAAAWIYSCIPPEGTLDRKLLACLGTSVVSGLLGALISSNRDDLTIATMSRDGFFGVKPSTRFTIWIQSINTPRLNKVQKNPRHTLLFGRHVASLISKVSAVALFYLTRHLSLQTALANLLAYSEKASKVATPILNRATSIRVPYTLFVTGVLVLAPAILKLTQIALLYKKDDANNDGGLLDITSRIGESLLHVRFALLSLGLSKTIPQSISTTIYGRLVNLLPKTEFTLLLNWLPASRLKGIFDHNYLFTHSFDTGLSRVIDCWWPSPKPCDVAILKDLFTQANRLPNPRNATDLHTWLASRKANIAQALQQNQISLFYALQLNQLVGDKIHQFLVTALRDHGWIASCTQDELPLIVQLCCHQLPEDLHSICSSILGQLRGPVSLDRFQAVHQSINGLELENLSMSISMALLSQKLNLDNLRILLSMALLNTLSRFYVDNSHVDLNPEETQAMVAIFGTTGWIHALGTDTASRERASFLSAQFYKDCFARDLRRYLANEPASAKRGEAIEHSLLYLGQQALWNFSRAAPPAGRATKLLTQHPSQSRLSVGSPWDAFLSSDITIPKGFVFATAELPAALAVLEQGISLQQLLRAQSNPRLGLLDPRERDARQAAVDL